MLAHELMDYIKHVRKGKEEFLAIKVDMSKAYDQVSWKFLRKVAEKIRVERSWIERVMMCVETFHIRLR